MDLNQTFAELADDALAAYAVEVRAAFDAIAALDTPTAEQIAEAESYADHLDAIKAETEQRETAAVELADRAAALRTRFSEDAAEDDEVEEDAEDEAVEAAVEEDAEEDEEPVEAAVEPKVEAKAKVATLARRVKRPAKPAPSRVPVNITAAADVPDFANGAKLDMEAVGKALVNRMRGFGKPTGDGTTESLQHFGVASFALDFPKELTIDRHSDDMEILTYAAKESRLPGGSLVAAGGWCAPSETLYDLCSGWTTDGMVSVPEVNASRGGIKFTKGPSFSDIYTNVGFCQTEAQAIAATAKTCFEVPCPPFEEVRLDACGLCIKAPILTNAAYPELVQQWLSGAMVAHQHKMNAKVLAAMATDAGTARVFAGMGGTTGDTLEALELVILQQRQKNRLGLSQSLEVVVPFWVKGAIRADMHRRSGRDDSPVTDSEIAAHFAAIGASVQFVYDWQPIDETAEVYPGTFNALVYPAGTFVKATTDVINLNAVYDAASLATNIYTALFFEQGIAVANLCYTADLITIPICNAGVGGAAEFTCTVTP